MRTIGLRNTVITALLLLGVTTFVIAGGQQEPTETDSPVEITYWRTLAGRAGEAQDELVEMFNESQDRVHVTVEFQSGYNDLQQKLMAAYAAGEGPEVSMLGTYEIKVFSNADVLMDLTPYITGENGLDMSDWSGTMAQAGVMNGRTVWLPLNVAAPVLYYNVEAFEEAGLPGPPETIEQFIEYARRLTVRDADGNVSRYGYATLNDWFPHWPTQNLLWSEGVRLTSRDYSNITFNDPGVIDLFSRLQELFAEGSAVWPDEASGGHRAMFINGKAAMILDSPAPLYDIVEGAVGFTPAVATYPAGAAGRIFAPGGGGIIMSANCPEEKRDAAWEFIRFMLQPENIAYNAQGSGYVAFSDSAIDILGDYITDDPYASIIYQSVQYLQGDFSVNASPAVRDGLKEAMQRIFIRLEDPTTVLNETDALVEANLENE